MVTRELHWTPWGVNDRWIGVWFPVSAENYIRHSIHTAFEIHPVFCSLCKVGSLLGRAGGLKRPGNESKYCMYIGFKTSFYVIRHLDSIASYLPTGLQLGFFRSWPSLYLPSSFSSVFLVLSFVSASTSMTFWVIFLLPFFEHGRTTWRYGCIKQVRGNWILNKPPEC